MRTRIASRVGLLAVLTIAQVVAGCGTLSDEQRQQVGGAIFFAAIAGIAEAVQNAAVRDRARDAVALPWSCSSKRVKARVVHEISDSSHVVRVRGCGREATLQCSRRECWELAPPGTYSSR